MSHTSQLVEIFIPKSVVLALALLPLEDVDVY
jgi:hypothetical protein